MREHGRHLTRRARGGPVVDRRGLSARASLYVDREARRVSLTTVARVESLAGRLASGPISRAHPVLARTVPRREHRGTARSAPGAAERGRRRAAAGAGGGEMSAAFLNR